MCGWQQAGPAYRVLGTALTLVPMILRSDDSGKSWSTVLPPESRRKG